MPFTFPEDYLNYYSDGDCGWSSLQSPDPPTDMSELSWSQYSELTAYEDIWGAGVTGEWGTTMPDAKAIVSPLNQMSIDKILIYESHAHLSICK